MGHSSTRAALIYLHSTGERQREIADTLSRLALDELKQTAKDKNGASGKRSGTQRARTPRRAS